MVAVEAAIAVAADVPLQATAVAAIRRRAAMVAAGPRTAVVDRRTAAADPTAEDRMVAAGTVVDMGGNTALDSFPA